MGRKLSIGPGFIRGDFQCVTVMARNPETDEWTVYLGVVTDAQKLTANEIRHVAKFGSQLGEQDARNLFPEQPGPYVRINNWGNGSGDGVNG